MQWRCWEAAPACRRFRLPSPKPLAAAPLTSTRSLLAPRGRPSRVFVCVYVRAGMHVGACGRISPWWDVYYGALRRRVWRGWPRCRMVTRDSVTRRGNVTGLVSVCDR